MQLGEIGKGKVARGYILILVILILLIFLTFYVSHLEIERIHQDLPKISGFVSFLPTLVPVLK